MPDKNRQSPEKNPGAPMDQEPATEKQPPQGSQRRSTREHGHEPKERQDPSAQGEPSPEDPDHPSKQGFRGRGDGPGRAEDVEETAQGE